MVKTAYASKPWAYRIVKNHGLERAVSPFNDFMTYAYESGSFLPPWKMMVLHHFTHAKERPMITMCQFPMKRKVLCS